MTPVASTLQRWARSLWWNVLLLGIVLVAIIPVIGLRGSFVNDEGAALSQVTQLRQQGTWFIANGFPEADPDGLAFPLDRSTQTKHGFAPLLNHPLYPLVLSGGDLLGGRFGIALVGVLGTLLAAIAAGLIGRELRPGLEPWCVWATGLASPLFFDSYILMAHSLGAGAAGLGALGAVRYLRRGGVGNIALCALGVACVVGLRTEGLFLGLAMGIVIGAIAFARRRGRADDPLPAGFELGAVTLVVTAGAFVINRFATKQLAPVVLPSTLRPLPTYGLIEGRISAFETTWLMPGYGGGWRLVGPFIIVVFAAFVTWRMRQRPIGRSAWLIAIAGIWFGAVFWVIFAHRIVVPGLLPAFPLLAVGLSAWKWPKTPDRVVTLLAGTVALFAVLVLATEYAVGGGAEWGSRYVAIGIPLVVPLVIVVVDRMHRTIPSAHRTLAAFALVPLLLAPAVVSVTSLRATHNDTATLVDSVVSHIDDTTPGDGGKPVVVTSLIPLPRLAWNHLDEARWLAASGSQLEAVLGRMQATGIEQFLFVTADRDTELGDGYEIVRCHDIGPAKENWGACIVERR